MHEYRVRPSPALLGLFQLAPGQRDMHHATLIPLKEFHPASVLSLILAEDRPSFYERLSRAEIRPCNASSPVFPNAYIHLATSSDSQQHAFVGLFLPHAPEITAHLSEVTIRPASKEHTLVLRPREPNARRGTFTPYKVGEAHVASPIHFVRNDDLYTAADHFGERIIGRAYTSPSRIDGFMTLGEHPADNFNHVVLFGSYVPSVA